MHPHFRLCLRMPAHSDAVHASLWTRGCLSPWLSLYERSRLPPCASLQSPPEISVYMRGMRCAQGTVKHEAVGKVHT